MGYGYLLDFTAFSQLIRHASLGVNSQIKPGKLLTLK
jgi:hypothetical protein